MDKLDNLRQLIAEGDDNEQPKKKEPKPGVIWMSRVPPGMNYQRLKSILEVHGEITRIYLQAEDDHTRESRMKGGGTKRHLYKQGWIEFKRKRVAKVVAIALNATPIGKQKCTDIFQGDLWNLKYLPRFKWEHLEGYLRDAKRSRAQRKALAMSVAEKECSQFLEQLARKKKASASTA